jgi:hypothetical protein
MSKDRAATKKIAAAQRAKNTKSAPSSSLANFEFLIPGTRFNVMTGPTGIGDQDTGAIHYAPDTKPDPAQDAYDRIYGMTNDFGGDKPLNDLEDAMYHEDASIKRMHDSFREDPNMLSMSEKKKLAVVYNRVADELENERKFG